MNLPLIAVRVVSAFAQFTPRPVGSPQRYAGGLGRFARARPDAQQFVHAPANGVEQIEWDDKAFRFSTQYHFLLSPEQLVRLKISWKRSRFKNFQLASAVSRKLTRSGKLLLSKMIQLPGAGNFQSPSEYKEVCLTTAMWYESWKIWWLSSLQNAFSKRFSFYFHFRLRHKNGLRHSRGRASQSLPKAMKNQNQHTL